MTSSMYYKSTEPCTPNSYHKDVKMISLGKITISTIRSGKGDCIHINYDGHNIIVDTGPTSTAGQFRILCNSILTKGESLDALVISHYDDDHIGGILKVGDLGFKNVYFNAYDGCIMTRRRDSMDDDKYYDYWGVQRDNRYIFYFDESGNCRKFWVNEENEKFNTDYNTDFVLAGLAFKDSKPADLDFELIRDKIGLQSNVKEIKFKMQFRTMDFLELMNKVTLYNALKIIDEIGAYIHFTNVNNLYYTLVELLDSLTDPKELEEMGFEYFTMKSILYETLYPEAERLQRIMCKYKYPNLSKNDIPNFCSDVINLFPSIYDRTTEQKYLVGCLKKAASEKELFFLEDNASFVMQENYLEFYIDPIRTYRNSEFYFDEEYKIQELFQKIPLEEISNSNNYQFVKSIENVYVQLSDVVAGTFGKLFRYVNTTDSKQMRRDIKELNERQVKCLELFAKLVYKSDYENKGFIHSLAPLKNMKRKDEFLLYFIE